MCYVCSFVAYGVSALFAVAAVALFWAKFDPDGNDFGLHDEAQVNTTQDRAEVEGTGKGKGKGKWNSHYDEYYTRRTKGKGRLDTLPIQGRRSNQHLGLRYRLHHRRNVHLMCIVDDVTWGVNG